MVGRARRQHVPGEHLEPRPGLVDPQLDVTQAYDGATVRIPAEVAEAVVDGEVTDLPRRGEVVRRPGDRLLADRDQALVGLQPGRRGQQQGRGRQRGGEGEVGVHPGCEGSRLGGHVGGVHRDLQTRLGESIAERRGRASTGSRSAPSRGSPGAPRQRSRLTPASWTTGPGRGWRCASPARTVAAAGRGRRSSTLRHGSGWATEPAPAPDLRRGSTRRGTRPGPGSRRGSAPGCRRPTRRRWPRSRSD